MKFLFILGWASRGQDKALAMASFLSLAKLFHVPGGVSSSSSSRPWLQDLQLRSSCHHCPQHQDCGSSSPSAFALGCSLHPNSSYANVNPGMVTRVARVRCVRLEIDGSIHPSAVGTVGGDDSVAAMVYVWRRSTSGDGLCDLELFLIFGLCDVLFGPFGTI
jgi:hypothetical protein